MLFSLWLWSDHYWENLAEILIHQSKFIYIQSSVVKIPISPVYIFAHPDCDFVNVILGVETASTKSGEHWNVSHEWCPAEAVWQTFQKTQEGSEWRKYVLFIYFMLTCCLRVLHSVFLLAYIVFRFIWHYTGAVKKMFLLSWRIWKTKRECWKLFF